MPTRVLIVDDSTVIREMIADAVRAAGLEVAGMASNGRVALQRFDEFAPDVVTLDIQMPEMDGLATLDAILARRPVPVIMVSTLTRFGAETTLEALQRGALDYVAKPDGPGNEAWREELVRKIRAMTGADVNRILEIRRQRAARIPTKPSPLTTDPPLPLSVTSVSSVVNDSLIAIGISTGGPPALARLFTELRPPMPPIVVVQHMPADFTKPFAWRLDSLSSLTIKEAATGDIVRPNHVYIAPGGKHLHLRREMGTVKCVVEDGEVVSGHRPSVDVMMRDAAKLYGSKCLGVIMTGMGRDGAEGCKAIRAAGGCVLGQDEASSDVYGMNKVAFLEGHVDRQFSLDEAAAMIREQIQGKRLRVGHAF